MIKTYDLVLKNATLVTFQNNGRSTSEGARFVEEKLNVAVSAKKIVKISSDSLSGRVELDLSGCHLLPGIIDSQVHFREPGLTHKEDLESGTRSAVMGGVTSIFEMPNTTPPTTTETAIANKFSLAKGRCWSNYAFFVGASPDNVSELAKLELISSVSGIKVFMGSSTGTLLVEDEGVLRELLKYGKRRVIVHSEDEVRLRARRPIAEAAAHPRAHPVWRDELTAMNSTERLVRLAREVGRKVHVLHVTTKQEMEFLAKNKDIASVEVLPQHLTVSAPECYERWGTLAQQNPPIRDEDHQKALWRAVNSGVVDVIASDHAPHTLEEKLRPYPSSPSGMTGVQTIVPLMAHHVKNKRLTLKRWIEMACENPRWVFGCFSKGRIEEGLDADFTVIDFNKKQTIETKWIQSKSKWTLFDGMKMDAWPRMTIVGGEVVMRDDELQGKPIGEPVQFQSV